MHAHVPTPPAMDATARTIDESYIDLPLLQNCAYILNVFVNFSPFSYALETEPESDYSPNELQQAFFKVCQWVMFDRVAQWRFRHLGRGEGEGEVTVGSNVLVTNEGRQGSARPTSGHNVCCTKLYLYPTSLCFERAAQHELCYKRTTMQAFVHMMRKMHSPFSFAIAYMCHQAKMRLHAFEQHFFQAEAFHLYFWVFYVVFAVALDVSSIQWKDFKRSCTPVRRNISSNIIGVPTLVSGGEDENGCWWYNASMVTHINSSVHVFKCVQYYAETASFTGER